MTDPPDVCDQCERPREAIAWSHAFHAWLCSWCRWHRTETELGPTSRLPFAVNNLITDTGRAHP